jgi:hypothetical protein
MLRLKIARRRWIGAGLGAAMAVGSGLALMPSHAAASYGCEPGTFYNVQNNYGASFDGLGYLFHDYNNGGTTVTFTTTISASATAAITFDVRGTVTIGGSAGVNIGVVQVGAQASAELSLGASAETSVTFSASHSAIVQTPPHWYANAQLGVWRVYTYGYYETVYSNCQVPFGEWISTLVPTAHTIGFEAGAVSTSAIPWIRNNAW